MYIATMNKGGPVSVVDTAPRYVLTLICHFESVTTRQFGKVICQNSIVFFCSNALTAQLIALQPFLNLFNTWMPGDLLCSIVELISSGKTK